jgi:LPXTG-site transpeptidase (sortase) family protein
MKPKLTEQDLEKLFIVSRSRNRKPELFFIKFFFLFIVISFALYFLLNFSAFSAKIAFWYKDQFGSSQTQELQKVVREAVNSFQTDNASLPNISDNSMSIEVIGLKAPIAFRVENEENETSKQLKNGLIHLNGTSLPGENGNSFITGHSSNYPWVKSNYNSVFALLDNVVVGDLIQVKFLDRNYIYRVTEMFVVGPEESNVLKPYKDKPTLTLMTCTPIGTNLKRLIVRSDQIIPDPATAIPSSASGVTALPAGVR